mmetsp:Transcript_39736/g.83027  ORF Transcript_39736/g.83027 Transcript_39736/m.83027 type:complete len:223 (+) Transcript_39736:428-1096(+)
MHDNARDCHALPTSIHRALRKFEVTIGLADLHSRVGGILTRLRRSASTATTGFTTLARLAISRARLGRRRWFGSGRSPSVIVTIVVFMAIIGPCGIDRARRGPRIVVAIVGPIGADGIGGHLGRSDPTVDGFRSRGAPSIAVPLRFSGFEGGLGGGFRCRCRGPLAPRHETRIGDITQVFQIVILVSGAITYHGIERFPAAAFSAFGAPCALFGARAVGFAR